MEIGKIIKEERTKRQLTQEQLAQEFFVTRQLISKWENGKSYPDLEQVLQLSTFFNLSLDYLMKEDHELLEDFNSSIKGRKVLKGIIVALASILILIFAGYLFFKISEGPFLDLNNVEIVSIKAKVLPTTQEENTATGELVTLPEDVEYQIELKSKKWYIDLSSVRLQTNRVDEKNVQIIILGQYSLFPKTTERTLTVTSERTNNALSPTIKINKKLWLFSFLRNHDEGDWGELLVDH